jgi:hypothetical protein
MATVLNSPLTTPDETERLLDVAGKRLYRLSVDQYHAMIGSVLEEDDSTEMLDGLLVKKVGKCGSHCVSLDLLRDLLLKLLPSGWILRLQDPITLDDSEPEPDAAVVRGTIRDFAVSHPMPDDVALVIEVADSTVLPDRKWKQRLYARNGVVEFWLVNLPVRRVEVYRQPDPVRGDFAHRWDFAADSSIPVVLDGDQHGVVQVADILP